MMNVILSFCDKSWIVEMLLIIKTLFKIACYIIPVIIIIVSIIGIFKAIKSGKEEDLFDNFKLLVKRIIAGLLIFFLPSIINYIFTGILNNHEVELYPRVGEHTIVLGTTENFRKKLDNLMIFYKNGLSKTGWNKYSVINLSYNGQIVCTKKNNTKKI